MKAIKTATSARLRWVIDKLRLFGGQHKCYESPRWHKCDFTLPHNSLEDREYHPRWWVSLGTLFSSSNWSYLSGGEFERSTLGLYGCQLKSGVSDQVAIAQKLGIFSKTERVGFEPTVTSLPHSISSRAHSTTLPPLQAHRLYHTRTCL